MQNANPTARVNADILRLAFGFAAAKGEPRHYLHGVSIEPAKRGVYVAATEGHVLGVFHDPSGEAEAPLIVKPGPDVLKACKPGKADPEERVAVIEGGMLHVHCADRTLAGESAELLDAQFPDWRRLLPAALPDTQNKAAAFQVRLLEKFKPVAQAAGDPPSLHLVAGDPESAAYVLIPGRPDFFGVIMPIKTSATGEAALPDFITELSGGQAPAELRANG